MTSAFYLYSREQGKRFPDGVPFWVLLNSVYTTQKGCQSLTFLWAVTSMFALGSEHVRRDTGNQAPGDHSLRLCAKVVAESRDYIAFPCC